MQRRNGVGVKGDKRKKANKHYSGRVSVVDGEDSLREKLSRYGLLKNYSRWLEMCRLKCVAGKWHLRGQGRKEDRVGIKFTDVTGSHGTRQDAQWEMRNGMTQN